ncbi:peptide/nickel transport system substrate-binding protein [Alkalispirochaeta americana]|uniref:Peptide/nickel transport system substrate-binding protein n=1 Tax=Alkalispirochaeta americana TaxID=159291 RepID=A0A1N6UHH2_9SPIO|nr:ABC transporter substrate-binding protein [Alkalispirochaeta americana]SIQ64911.1 peptide/nickel transport system substrate-binding protein [Alkalispirochaeta americana]
MAGRIAGKTGKTPLAVVVLAVLTGLLMLPAWAGAAGRTEEDAAPGTRLVYGISGDPDTLDPHATTGTLTFQTMRSVYDTLVEPDQEGEIVPALASSWEVSSDGLRWVFELRQGVVFHDGQEFTSRDVKASLERLRDPDFASPSSHEFAVVDQVIPHGPWRVELVLAEPHAPLLATLASGWAAMLPADRITQGHDFGAEPVGTGPFRFERWLRDSEILLSRNDSYWMEEAPFLKDVQFRVITEQAVMAQALARGRIDVADIVVEPELSFLRNTDAVKLYESTSALVMVLAINTRRAPLDQLEVRQGINAAIDKQAALDIAYAGGQVVGTFMDVSNPYYADFTDLYCHDPDFAREVADRTSFDRDLVIVLPQNFEPHVRAGELYHEMLRQAGFPVRTQLVDWSTWLSDVYRGGQFDLTVIGHTGKLDPHGRLARYGTEKTYVGWEDEETAAAIEEARRALDPERRRELYGEALHRMARELPFVFVGSPYRYVGLNAALEGFFMDSQLDTPDLRRVRFSAD